MNIETCNLIKKFFNSPEKKSIFRIKKNSIELFDYPNIPIKNTIFNNNNCR